MELQKYEMVYQKNFVEDKESHLGACWLDNEELVDEEIYKQVFNGAEQCINALGYERHERNAFPVYNNFHSLMRKNKKEGISNTWNGLASVYLLLTWYSLQILHAPWRKSHLKIKAYSGNFQHLVYGNFSRSVTENLMERLGFIYIEKQQAFIFQQSSNWRDALIHAGMDFFLLHVKCFLSSKQHGTSTVTYDLTSAALIDKINVSSSSRQKMEQTTKEQSTKGRRSLSKWEEPSLRVRSKWEENDPSPRIRVAQSIRADSSHRHALTPHFNKDGDSCNAPVNQNICYPPNNALVSSITKKEKSNRTQKNKVSLSFNIRPTANYVTALPMSSHTGLGKVRGGEFSRDTGLAKVRGGEFSRDSRVESGYYSEWMPIPDRKYEPRDAFAHTLPSKRPPGDGEPSDNPPPLYHEIDERMLPDIDFRNRTTGRR